MCRQLSPGGRLACANPVCNGRSHIWVHESSAPDRKRDLDTQDQDRELLPMRPASATPLETFEWLSGAIAAPPGDLALAWQTP